jgi:lipopolysaccharide export LptBFGC system permease protein LptF
MKTKLRVLLDDQKKELTLKLPQHKNPSGSTIGNGASLIELIEKTSLVPSLAINKSLIDAREVKAMINKQIRNQKEARRSIIECYMAMYMKLSLALNCVLGFCIAASLGLLSGKDRLAISAVISSLLLLVYYLIENYAQDQVRQENVNTLLGMFASNLFLLPFAIYFFNKAQKSNSLELGIGWFTRRYEAKN